MNRWRDIFDAIADAGIEVYAPGGHRGICTSPYCVVQPAGGYNQTASGGFARYRVILLVPADRPSLIDPLAEDVRAALLPLEREGVITLSQPSGPVVTDDVFDALTGYIDYVSYFSH